MGDMGEAWGMGADAGTSIGSASAAPKPTYGELQAALIKANHLARRYRKEREQVKVERDAALARAARSEAKVKAFLGD